MKRVLWTWMALFLAVPAARAAVVAAPGYAAHTIATPDTAVGGVVRRGAAILVGQGSFGAGGESVVRLDGGGPTTVATGFNSLGGFDLDAAGTLYVTDNCKECVGAATGDTVYAIPDALTRTTPLAALGAEVVPAGTIPFAGDVLVAPGGALLVADPAGPSSGRVVKIVGATATDLITALDYTGGLAITSASTLLVGNADGSFVGSVRKYGLDGTPAGTLVGSLPGEYAHALDGDDFLLVTGEYSFDCTGLLRAVAPDGSVTERARGFCFSADAFFDGARDEALVLDGGTFGPDAKQILAVCRDRDCDGVCDADDAPGDGVIGKAKLGLAKLGTPPGDDTLTFKGTLTVPAAPPIDPVTSGAHIRAGSVADVVAPPGAGWKGKDGSFKYQDATTKLSLKASKKVPGLVQFAESVKAGSFLVDPTDLPRHASLILDSAAGQCGDAEFAGPAPAPACVYKAKSGKVQCH